MTQTTYFNDINAFREVFSEAKKLRRTRHPSHILVVEDDALTRRILTGAMAETNAVITEEEACGAIASYLLYAPDIVFLDIGLPDIDGFSVLDHLITLDPEAFVVMVSSHDDSHTINKALNAGAKGFIPKPFKKEMLRNYIQGSSMHHHKSPM